jgi:putative transposase
MGRPKRAADGGLIYHVLNRANGRLPIFERAEDYDAFERVIEEAVERTQTRLLAYCVMPNHWHLVVWPHVDGELSQFTGWLTLTHAQRWHAFRQTSGSGHLYQGRFKSFPIQDDDHFFTVCRYVERNALRARLVQRAEEWRWCSLHRWQFGNAQQKALLSAWPQARRPGWADHVNAPQTEAELIALRSAIARGRPFGADSWCERIGRQLGLESTLRPRGRPKKPQNGS